ncbi:FtsL-like putative cell division protein [Faecalibacter rhinopitheci]|uniref:FtsL-like putative cell division protein n=1 Tax=Faecalibacter rhinopitheci TaxID=2779678 RepID=UPI001D1674C4|nr:FtsL-like putative cell division protein [Faecalibacter rhinopitheci]
MRINNTLNNKRKAKVEKVKATELPSKNTVLKILAGDFLTKTGSQQNWQFILFLVFLAFLSITSSHWVDRKVVRINELRESVEDLKSQYTDKHRDLMRMQLETEIISKTEMYGLKIPDKQPYYIVNKVDE